MLLTGVPLIFFVASLLAGLTFTVFTDPYIRARHRRVMLIIIGLCFLLIVQNYVENALAAGEPRVLARTLLSIVGYTVRPVVIVLFFYIVAPKRRYLPAWLIIGVNTGVYLTALFSPVCFWISESNHFNRGPLSYCCLYVSGALLAYLLYLTLRVYRRRHWREIAIPVLTAVLIIVSVWMDSGALEASQSIAYLTVAMAVSCVFYYIWLHMQFVREHEEDLKAQQRIRIMMSQIQPHFLYNTLSTIQALCHTRPEKAAETTGQFSEYLRRNLDALGQTGLIPFRKELEHTQVYAQIEMTRFPNVRVDYDIRDDAFFLPPLTLQPLVENAIRYGVRIRDEGVVTVSARRAQDAHEITIRDNGKGFDAAAVEQMDATHIGIRNVRQRLRDMCGGEMQIESRKDEGTTVTIRIPSNCTFL